MHNKVKYEMEFTFQSSPQLLYQYISTPSGLSEWFADNVNSRGEVYTFLSIITDFTEEDEVDEAKMLWENQISDLKHVLGSL